jgi:hypothetical protein
VARERGGSNPCRKQRVDREWRYCITKSVKRGGTRGNELMCLNIVLAGFVGKATAFTVGVRGGEDLALLDVMCVLVAGRQPGCGKAACGSVVHDGTWGARELLKDFVDYKVVWRVPERVMTDPNLRSEVANKVGLCGQGGAFAVHS